MIFLFLLTLVFFQTTTSDLKKQIHTQSINNKSCNEIAINNMAYSIVQWYARNNPITQFPEYLKHSQYTKNKQYKYIESILETHNNKRYLNNKTQEQNALLKNNKENINSNYII